MQCEGLDGRTDTNHLMVGVSSPVESFSLHSSDSSAHHPTYLWRLRLRLLRCKTAFSVNETVFIHQTRFLLAEFLGMDVSEAIANRRSIRTYKKQDLPKGTVETLSDAGRQASCSVDSSRVPR